MFSPMYDNFEINTYTSSLLSSNMHTLKFGKKLIVIDPFISFNLLDYMEDNSLVVDYIILTHEHYDHISGVNRLKEKFETKVVCSNECAKAIKNPILNFSKYFNTLLQLMDPGNNTNDNPKNINPYLCHADITFINKRIVSWMGNKLELTSTPGHSKGSICILVNKKYLFSGDSLLLNLPTVTRLKGGSIKEYYGITLKYFNSLSPNTIVLPGHYDKFSLNSRLKS